MTKSWDSMNNKKAFERYVYTLSHRLRYVTHCYTTDFMYIYAVDIMCEESDIKIEGDYKELPNDNGNYGITDLRFEDKSCLIFILNYNNISSEYCQPYENDRIKTIATPRYIKALNLESDCDWDEEYKKVLNVEELDITQDKRREIQNLLDGIQDGLNIVWYNRKKGYVIAIQTDGNMHYDYKHILTNIKCERHSIDKYTIDVVTYELKSGEHKKLVDVISDEILLKIADRVWNRHG